MGPATHCEGVAVHALAGRPRLALVLVGWQADMPTGDRQDVIYRLQRAMDNQRHGRVAFDPFINTIRGILADYDHAKWRAEQEAMTPDEYNRYWAGYADDEFLVRRR